jgi:small subunit ribosomal protein S6
MALYETTFIIRQDISVTEVEKLAGTYMQLIADMGGKVLRKEYWGLKNLAYIVKKNRKGHYIMLILDAPFEAVKEMQRLMSINEDLLRNVTFRLETYEDAPSPMMSSSKAVSEEKIAESGDRNER